MPRNSSGTYALPSGNPVVTNTLIQSTWANTTLSDVSTAMTDSLDRNGRGAMLAALKNVDGTAVAPALSFSSEGTLGIYRAAAGVLGFAVGGALVLSLTATGLTFTTPLVLPIGSAAAPSLTFVSNTNTGIFSPATNQVAITTNGAQRVLVDATGIVTLATGNLLLTSGNVGLNTTPSNAYAASRSMQVSSGGATVFGSSTTAIYAQNLSLDAAGSPLYTVTGPLNIFRQAGVLQQWQTAASGTAGAAATLVTQMTLDQNSNLGIGASPAGSTVKLTLSDGTITTLVGFNYSANTISGIGTNTAHALGFITSGAERMRIDTSGNLAIATLSASARLHVRSDVVGTAVVAMLDNGAGGGGTNIAELAFANAGAIKSSIQVAVFGNDFMTFNVFGNTERMRIDASGRVGIGMTPTANRLEVAGTVSTLVSGATDTQFAANVNGVLAMALGANNSGSTNSVGAVTGSNYVGSVGGPMVFTTAGAERVRIDLSGNVGIGQTPANAYSGGKVLQVFGGCTVFGSPTTAILGQNLNLDSSGNPLYALTAVSSMYKQASGSHQWNVAASGTAGTSITYAVVMTLDNSGNLGVGAAPGSARLTLSTSGAVMATFDSTNANGGYNPYSVSGAVYGYHGTGAQLVTSGGLTDFAMRAVNNMLFSIGAVEKLRITSAGVSTFSGGAATTPNRLGSTGGAVALDCSKSNVFTMTLTSNMTSLSITNISDGQTINVLVTQDGTGGRTWAGLIAGNGFIWPNGVVGVLSTAASARDLLCLTFDATAGKFYCTLTKGFA